MTTVENAVKNLKKAGFAVEQCENAKHLMIARKDGMDTITIYRNGGSNFDKVATFQIGRSDDNCFARTVPQAVWLAGVR